MTQFTPKNVTILNTTTRRYDNISPVAFCPN